MYASARVCVLVKFPSDFSVDGMNSEEMNSCQEGLLVFYGPANETEMVNIVYPDIVKNLAQNNSDTLLRASQQSSSPKKLSELSIKVMIYQSMSFHTSYK